MTAPGQPGHPRLVIDEPPPGTVALVVSDGTAYAVMHAPRLALLDEDAAGGVCAVILARIDERIAELRAAGPVPAADPAAAGRWVPPDVGAVLSHLAENRDADAVVVVDGNADDAIAGLVAAGWEPDDVVDLVGGKRIRYLRPPS